ncbi:unnamed protein product [Somion occarium]|uniref:Uncharacterized protein n=1 Tax=Somion occarium TaxID=3059160 RepID=A0ABP1EAA7_9APHY
MASDASNRYQFNTTDGKAEWASLVPGDGVVHLEIVRDRSTPGPGEYTELARHCLNYIKQMMLCRADAYLEPFWYDNHNGPIDLYSFYECKDWGAVYGEIKKNQEEYIKVAER